VSFAPRQLSYDISPSESANCDQRCKTLSPHGLVLALRSVLARLLVAEMYSEYGVLDLYGRPV